MPAACDTPGAARSRMMKVCGSGTYVAYCCVAIMYPVVMALGLKMQPMRSVTVVPTPGKLTWMLSPTCQPWLEASVSSRKMVWPSPSEFGSPDATSRVKNCW